MADKPNVDSEEHELKLGKSFDTKSRVAFHSIRYDFKPESLDATKASTVAVEQNNSVTVSVPHVEGSGTSHTVFKGNKRPVQKECVLVIDHDSGEFTLEKLSNAIQLKKTRVDGSSKAGRPHTPVEQKKRHGEKRKDACAGDGGRSKKEAGSSGATPKKEHTDVKSSSQSKKEERSSPVPVPVKSDSSSDDSGSDMDISPAARDQTSTFSLSQELQLSESGSDSD